MLNTVHNVRTFGIFLDLPIYLEIRLQDLPIMVVGQLIDFDLRIPKFNHKIKEYQIQGEHKVVNSIIKYGGKYTGATQYLSFKK